ncbi:lipopolysaccharide biosynthesis protein [Blattabacterium cuenoti]|uniref:lipopolysaccharide biosynthesis protein n=1 Tax=Blattabacterium cuenoti TaxID=1653831 RepID=UPI00163CB128|nr:oligosaccharide flippase family protein [Blattabacterium cuenoti]
MHKELKKKKKKEDLVYKKLAIQTIIYTIGSFLPKIMNYALLKFFTISLKQYEFSLYSDMYSLSFLLIGFLSFGLENTYFRFLYKRSYKKKIVFSTSIIVQLLINLFFLFIAINSIEYLTNLLGYSHHKEYFLMFFLIIFFDTSCIVPMAWFRINEKPFFHTSVNVIITLVQSIVITYMFVCHKNNILHEKSCFFFLYNLVNSFTDQTGYIFFSNVVSSLCNFLLILPIIINEVSLTKFNKFIALEMLRYGFPIMLGTIAFSVNENLDKILIKRWVSDEVNGSYSACYKIAAFMSLYIRIFRLGIEPFLFKKSGDTNAKHYYEEVIYFFILFGLIFYVLICGNISFVTEFLIDKKYHFAISIIPIIMMGNLFLGIYTNLSILYKTMDKPIIGTYISMIGVIVTLFFNIIFIIIPNRSFMIPAWGTLVSYGCMLLVLFFWIKRNVIQFFSEIKSIILHFIFAIFIVYVSYRSDCMYFRFFLQCLYLITIFSIEKKRFLNLL